MKFLHACFAAALLVAACGDDDHNQNAREVEAKAQLDTLTSEITLLEDQLAESNALLVAVQAQLEDSDRDSKAALDVATRERDALQGLLDDAKAALAEAEVQLASRDYAEALEEFAKARAALDAVTAARARVPGTVELNVAFMFGDAPLALETPYSIGGGTVSFRSLRYWLSNVSLIREDDTEVEIPKSFYAMEVRGPMVIRHVPNLAPLPPKRRETISLASVPPGTYKGIAFHMGVDAGHNDDLSKTDGELNVLTTLVWDAWMWFTSYIFTSTVADYTPTDAGEGDDPVLIAWENGTNSDYRRMEFDFGSTIQVDLTSRPRVGLAFQAESLFEGLAPENALNNDGESVIGASTGALRETLADNWQAGFVFKSVSSAP